MRKIIITIIANVINFKELYITRVLLNTIGIGCMALLVFEAKRWSGVDTSYVMLLLLEHQRCEKGTKRKYFQTLKDKPSSEQLKKIEQINPLGHSKACSFSPSYRY